MFFWCVHLQHLGVSQIERVRICKLILLISAYHFLMGPLLKLPKFQFNLDYSELYKREDIGICRNCEMTSPLRLE